jgi:hypothetical protein
VDRGLEYEQNIAGRKIFIVIFQTKSIALQDLLPHVPACLALLLSQARRDRENPWHSSLETHSRLGAMPTVYFPLINPPWSLDQRLGASTELEMKGLGPARE